MLNSNIIPLPRTAQAIANVIGREATLALASQSKHGNLYVPKQDISDNHYIVRTIGRDLAEQLQDVFGGESVPLPRCTCVQKAARDARLREELGSIAAKFGISQSHAARLLYPRLVEHNRRQTRQRKRSKRRAAQTKLPEKLVRLD